MKGGILGQGPIPKMDLELDGLTHGGKSNARDI